ncbi:golgin subfamily A member 6-like protein 7 [Leptopilina heterotoma]|uniref:golgin subfamily A member 6-like protein 7 n=1 Tax=Leptopilina heterotoma TaxID=63436 RepID=UPI001CA91511|nr:golgin subfamily A member 6-like protein 7 [Leptopilina heterotoma]
MYSTGIITRVSFARTVYFVFSVSEETMNIAVRSNHVPGYEAVKSRCRPINVPGTANVVCGYRLREPGKGGFHSGNHACRVGYSSSSDRIRERELDSSNFIFNAQAQARQEKHLRDTINFIQRTKKKSEKTQFDMKIKLGIEAYDVDLNRRREKLRNLLLREEEALTEEIMKNAEETRENYQENLKTQIEDSRVREENARLSFIKSKRYQQFLDMCPEAKDYFTKKTIKNIKYCNLMQIADNNARKNEEKILESMWHEQMLNNVKEIKLRENEEAKKREIAILDLEASLRKQIAGKEALMSEERRRVKKEQCEYVRKNCEEHQKEEASRFELKKNKKNELKRDLKDQLKMARMCQAERVSKEAAMERTFQDLIEKELAMAKREEKLLSNDLRKEQLAYLKSVQEFREQETRRNAEVEEIVGKYEKDAVEMGRRAMKERDEARARELQKVLDIRRMQLEEKEEIKLNEKERINRERDVLTKQLENDVKLMDYERKFKKTAALRHQMDLINQKNYLKNLRIRERNDVENVYRKYHQCEEEKYQRLKENLLNS